MTTATKRKRIDSRVSYGQRHRRGNAGGAGYRHWEMSVPVSLKMGRDAYCHISVSDALGRRLHQTTDGWRQGYYSPGEYFISRAVS